MNKNYGIMDSLICEEELIALSLKERNLDFLRKKKRKR